MLRQFSLRQLVLTCGVLTLGLVGASSAAAEEAREVTLLYNASVKAELVDCGCKSRPLGGLARRAALIEHIEKDHPHAVLLDGGGLFGDPTKDTLEQSMFAAEQTAAMGYSVVGVGPYDIGHGIDAIRSVSSSTGLRFVSANLVDADGDLLFAPYEIVEENGVRIAVTSVFDPQYVAAPYNDKVAGMNALEPAEALRNRLPELHREADVVVVMTNLKGSGSVDLLRALGGAPEHQIDLVIEGIAARQYRNPRKFGNSRILAANDQGKYLGQADLIVKDGAIVDLVSEVHAIELELREDETMAQAVADFQESQKTLAGGR